LDFELICLLVMLAAFLLANLVVKLPVSISMLVGAVAGALVGGEGIPLRHIFEGSFAYLDTFLIISTAMLFMTVIQKSGALEALTAGIVNTFYKVPAIMLVLLMFIIMFPGMITGSSTAAVLSAGLLVTPVLLMIGIPREKAGAIIAMGAIMGMAAPPVNIPAMLICGGIDMPFVGFEGPLFLVTIVGGVFSVLFLGLSSCKNLQIEQLRSGLNMEIGKKHGFKLYIPILFLVVMLVVSKLVPSFPQLGTALIFLLSAVIGLFTGEKIDIVPAATEAIDTTIPVLAKLVGVGAFIQVMTLVGVRGWIVISCLALGTTFLYVFIATIMPAFGAISSYGSASVMGVPFLLVLIQQGGDISDIAMCAMISFICCLGDLMPPTALAGNYAAAAVELPYTPVFKKCIIPFLFCLAIAMICLLNSGALAWMTA